MASPSSSSDSLAALPLLEARILALERTIGVSRTSSNLTDRVVALLVRMRELEATTPLSSVATTCMSMYASARHLVLCACILTELSGIAFAQRVAYVGGYGLGDALGLSNDELTSNMALSEPAKSELIIASEPQIQQLASSFREIEPLTQYINPNQLESMSNASALELEHAIVAHAC
jgi:hypothetical protein